MKKLLLSLTSVTLISLSVFSYADTPSAASATTSEAANTSCRKVMSAKDKTGTVYCGTTEQWAELDRRASLANAGVTCRTVQGNKERCMTADQWRQYERQVNDLMLARGLGSDNVTGSSFGPVPNGAALEAQQAMQASYIPAAPAK